MPIANKQARNIHLKGALGKLRTEKFLGRDHIVVPVVMLMEGVLWPSNAPTPEYVPLETLTAAYGSWNGEPVLTNHPSVNGQAVSANTPIVLEAMQFGHVFGVTVKDKKLVGEAWLDQERAEAIGEPAKRYLERLKDPTDQIEVSVGAIVVTEKKVGKFNGKEYGAIWREVYPDHLAFLPKGDEGACSIAMGCGAPRAAARHLVTVRGLEKETMSFTMKSIRDKIRSLPSDVMRMLQVRSPEELNELVELEGMTDSDLRQQLYEALFAIEPGFVGLGDVIPDDKQVVYGVMPEDRYVLYRRTYNEDNGSVTINDDRVEVERKSSYVPVSSEARAAAAGGCGCHNPQGTILSPSSTAHQSAASASEDAMHKYDERITALIASPHTPWKEIDRKHMQTWDEDRMREVEQTAKKAGEDATVLQTLRAAEEARSQQRHNQGGENGGANANNQGQGSNGQSGNGPQGQPTGANNGQGGQQGNGGQPQSGNGGGETTTRRETTETTTQRQASALGFSTDVDDYLRDPSVPKPIVEIVQAHLAAENEKRRSILLSLKGSTAVMQAYRPEDLDQLPTPDLEKIAKIANVDTNPPERELRRGGGVVDFAGRGTAQRAAMGTDAGRVPEAPKLYDKVRELRGGRK